MGRFWGTGGAVSGGPRWDSGNGFWGHRGTIGGDHWRGLFGEETLCAGAGARVRGKAGEMAKRTEKAYRHRHRHHRNCSERLQPPPRPLPLLPALLPPPSPPEPNNSSKHNHLHEMSGNHYHHRHRHHAMPSWCQYLFTGFRDKSGLGLFCCPTPPPLPG